MTRAVDPAPALPLGIAAIRRAAERIAGTLARTPTLHSPALSEATGAEVHLKLETLHRTGSFKERGALNRLLDLAPDERARGVIAMSAGNHAQGVAYHAGRLGIPATIVMPAHTPFTKVARTEQYGARVVLTGETLSEAQRHAEALAQERALTLIHPYDDPAVIAGQGTVGVELAEDAPPLDAVIVPIGGGGLMSGVAIALRALSPTTEMIGVESALYPSMRDALAGRTGTYRGATLAEGIAVKAPGRLTRAIIGALVADIALVDEAAIERAVELLAMRQRLVVEGAGAAGVAALLADPARFAGRRVGIVVCGGNIDGRVLASVLMRGLVREGRLVSLRIGIEDVPGALSRVAAVIGTAGGNIVEVHHRRLIFAVPIRHTDLDVAVETRDADHAGEIVAALEAAGFRVERRDEVDG